MVLSSAIISTPPRLMVTLRWTGLRVDEYNKNNCECHHVVRIVGKNGHVTFDEVKVTECGRIE